MKRRTMLLSATTLAMPRIARAQAASTLKFVPYADLAMLDPIATGNYSVRNHAMMVFDTLYGVDDRLQPRPQMLAGHVVENDGRAWRLTLRDGLRFHDGAPVLARDAVASLRRWAARDSAGNALFAATDELSAPDDRTLQFRLKRPFPLLPAALGKAVSNVAVIMPERLAATDPFKPVTDMTGSGPYRFVAAEQMTGVRAVYERFAGYVPRQEPPSLLAGGKVANFARIEWHIIPDPATAAAALQKGEVDWWEQPTTDYWASLKARPDLTFDILEPSGAAYHVCRLNHLTPPFSNPKVRQAALAAISQSDVQTAGTGTDPAMWRNRVGFFSPDSPMASTDGMEALRDPPDLGRARRMLAESGYAGEKVVMISTPITPTLFAAAQVITASWRDIGFNADLQAGDVATLIQRLTNKNPVDAGGWSAEADATAGMATFDPLANSLMRGNGSALGWPQIPRLEALRDAWLAEPDAAARKELCRQIQLVCFAELPYIPTGIGLRPTAYSRTLTGLLRGILFYGVRRT
jgi:peptide/nickel transport system substrate-binding protein